MHLHHLKWWGMPSVIIISKVCCQALGWSSHSVIKVVTWDVCHCLYHRWLAGRNAKALMVISIGWHHIGLLEAHRTQVVPDITWSTPKNEVMTTSIGDRCCFVKPEKWRETREKYARVTHNTPNITEIRDKSTGYHGLHLSYILLARLNRFRDAQQHSFIHKFHQPLGNQPTSLIIWPSLPAMKLWFYFWCSENTIPSLPSKKL